MTIIAQDWLNLNETRAYPLHDRATRTDARGRRLPENVLADLNLRFPRALGSFVFVSSVGITPAVVSLTLAAVDYDPFSESGTPGFSPLAVLTLRRPVVRFRNYPLQPLQPGVGGWVAFGQGAVDGPDVSVLFDDPKMGLVVGRCFRAHPAPPVTDISRPGPLPRLAGVVQLRGTTGQIRVRSEERIVDGRLRTVAFIGLNLDDDPIGTLETFAGECGHRPSGRNCRKRPIESINDVTPDCAGNIDVLFEGYQIIGDVGDGLVVDSVYGLAGVCPPTQFNLVGAGTEDCGVSSSNAALPDPPPEPSSTNVESSSSYAPPPSSSSSSGPYCEDFETGSAKELEAVRGEFEVLDVTRDDHTTKRYLSAGGRFGIEQTAIDPYRRADVNSVYVLEATIRPLDPYAGHLVFGYHDQNNFFVLGVQVLNPDLGQRAFYVAQRTPLSNPPGTSLDGTPDGRKYLLLQQVEMPPLPDLPTAITDYRVRAELSVAGGFTIVDWSVEWEEAGTPRNTVQSLAIPRGSVWSAARNDVATFGVGVVGCVCEFDDFGWNCPSSSSSSSSSGSGGGDMAWYGDGSDGPHTVSADETLTRDVYYDTLVVDPGKTLYNKGFLIFSRVSIENNGVIDNSGADGAAGSAGGAAGVGGKGGQGGGGQSGDGGAGGAPSSNGDSANDLYGACGGNGGNGGAGTVGIAGLGGTVHLPGGGDADYYANPINALGNYTAGGCGGGGGGGSGANQAAGGGGGGGLIMLASPVIFGSGVIRARGGAGGDGDLAEIGGGGGGAGGYISTLTETGPTGVALDVAFGAAGGQSGGGGAAGYPGVVGRTTELHNS